MPIGTKTPASLATKDTDLTTAYAGWQLDVETYGFTTLAFLLSHDDNTSASTITLLLSYSDDGETYYPVSRVSSSNALEDDEVTWAVSADDTLALRVNVPDVRYVRLSAKADAVDATAGLDALSCEVVGGIA